MAESTIVKVEIENLTRVEKDVYYLRTSSGNMRIHGSRIVADTVNRSKKIFRQAIQQYVYSIPPTTYDRTNVLGSSVRSQGFSAGLGRGEIYIDKSVRGPNGYFYPDTVEHGLNRHPAYYGRHFWAKGKQLALASFRSQMKPYADEIAAKLLGR
jgi:hypothetical protein